MVDLVCNHQQEGFLLILELDAGVMRKSMLLVSFAVINIINLGCNLYKCITEAYEFVAKKNTFFCAVIPYYAL